MRRKRATPAPAFKQPQPFNPLSGQFATMGSKGPLAAVTMAQVCEEDTYDNYVLCNVYDPEIKKTLLGVPVAKQYGERGTNPYSVGNVLTVSKSLSPLGQNPGKASESMGQPADLEEAVELLMAEDGTTPVQWIVVGGGASDSPEFYGITTEAIAFGGSGTVAIWEEDSLGNVTDTGTTETAYAPWILTTGSIAANKRVEMVRSKKSGRLICKNWEC